MDTPLRLISKEKLFGYNSTVPFPFGERDTSLEDRLFGERKPSFNFSKMAEEFEEEEDSGIDSEVSSTISPGSVASLTSPPLGAEQTRPMSLVVRDMNKPDNKPAKHWKKSLTRNFLKHKNQENSLAVPLNLSSPVSSRLSAPLSPLSPNPLMTSRTQLPVPVAPTRPVSRPRIVQPWASPAKPIVKIEPQGPPPPYSTPPSFNPTAWSSPIQEPSYHPAPPPPPPQYLPEQHHFYQNSIFSTEPLLPVKEPVETYHCYECKKSFSTQSGFLKHQQLHSSNQIQKEFTCKYCSKHYTSQSALKMHIRTHTLPCKCPECGKSFSRPWLLQGHMRTHTGEKPFSCDHCSRNFADKSNLRAHLQTHLQNKKYCCPGCRKSFSRMSLLNKHTEAGCLNTSNEDISTATMTSQSLRS